MISAAMGLLPALVLSTVACSFAAATVVTRRSLRAAERREKEWEAMVNGLVNSLNTAGDSLKKSNETVATLIEEKRGAWGIPSQRSPTIVIR